VRDQVCHISRTMSYFLRGRCEEVNAHMVDGSWVPVVFVLD
jgi:hypothetical protein